MLFCAVTSERWFFLDIFLSEVPLRRVDCYDVQCYGNNWYFIQFANTEFTDEAHSSATERFSYYGNTFLLASFLPWRWLKMRFSAGRELLNASQLLTDDEAVGSFPFCCSFAFRKRCFSCTVQTMSKLRINNADVHTAAVMHCLITLISAVTVISAFRASCA